MKKRFNILVLLVLICATISAQSKNSIKENKVRSVTEYKQDVDKNGAKTKESYTLYDANGNILEEIEYDSAGKIKNHSKYQYDSNNNKIKETELTPDGKISKTYEYKYSSTGLRTERSTYDAAGKLKSKRLYQYEYNK
jgi:hypothetical protein